MTFPVPQPVVPGQYRERWFVDGWELTDGVVRDVEKREDLYRVGYARGDSVSVAGRHGSMVSGLKRYGQGGFTLHCWLAGHSRQDLEHAYDSLLRAIGPVHRLVTFVRILSDGSQRTCRGRLADNVNLAPLGQIAGRVDLTVVVPSAFWTDTADSTDSTTPSATSPQPLLLSSKARSTGPMSDLRFTITGPATNPTVQVTSDPALADSFTYVGVIPAGCTLVVDSGLWTVSGTGAGFTPSLGNLVWTGARILEVPPAPILTAAPAVQLSGASFGPSTSLAVTGRQSFLT